MNAVEIVNSNISNLWVKCEIMHLSLDINMGKNLHLNVVRWWIKHATIRLNGFWNELGYSEIPKLRVRGSRLYLTPVSYFTIFTLILIGFQNIPNHFRTHYWELAKTDWQTCNLQKMQHLDFHFKNSNDNATVTNWLNPIQTTVNKHRSLTNS